MRTTEFAAVFALLAAACFAAPILPTTEWQDISPTNTLEDVGKGAGYATTNDVNAVARQMASGATDLWSADQKAVFTAYGQQYGTHYEDNGAWEQIAANGVLHIYTNGTYVAGRSWYEWRALGNSVLAYCPTNGAIYRYVNSSYELQCTIATNLDPHVDNLGSFTNSSSSAEGNIFRFVQCGLVKNPEAQDSVVFKSSIASDAVTGIRIGSSTSYSKGLFTIPDYAASISELDDKIYNKDMTATWPSYQTNSVVGRILALEGGGANEAYLKKTSISYFFDETTTADSIVSNITRNTNAIADNKKAVERDYVKYASATGIAEAVAADKIASTVDEAYIQGKNFYNKDEVNTIISNKVEQKRILHLYDDEEDPWQRADSKGYLYKYEYQDLGGYWTVREISQSATTNTMQLSYTGTSGSGSSMYYRWQMSSSGNTFWYKMYPSDGSFLHCDSFTITRMPAGICPTNSTASLITNITYMAGTTTYIAEYTEQTKVFNEVPYDQFKLKSEADNEHSEIYSSMDARIPTLYMPGSTNVKTRVNPLFKTFGTFSITSPDSIIQLNADNYIRIPVNTKLNSKVEIGFIAAFPYLDTWSDGYTFFRSSDVQTFPSAANFKSTYNFAMYYPTAKTYRDFVAPLDYRVYNKNIKVTLTVDKVTGKATFAATNIVDGGAQVTVTYPDGAYNRSTSFDYVDIACFPNAHMAQYSPNSSLNLLVGSMYVRYNDGEKNMLVGDWADTYVPLYRVYADKQIVNGNAIMLDVATPSKYGAVKPDGKTIRVNTETGQLEADAGGVDLSDVVKLLTQTNAADQTVFSNVDTNSIVGRVLAAQTDVTELDADVKALVSTISNLNTRLEAVLNGGQQ